MNRREFIVSALAFAMLAGCSGKFNEVKIPEAKKYNFTESDLAVISTIDSVKSIWDKGRSQIVETGFSVTDAPVKTFPWYIGPNPALSKDEYVVRKYAGDPLLFVGFGLEARLRNFISKSGSVTPPKAQEMIGQCIRIFSDNDPEEIFVVLKEAEKEYNIKLADVVEEEKIARKAKEIIEWEFSQYSRYEGKPATSFLKDLPFFVNGYEIRLTEEDFRPYAMFVLIAERFAKNGIDGFVLNDSKIN